MKMACQKKDLFESLTHVSYAVSSKSNIPALEGILMKITKNRLFLAGSDLDIFITCSIDVKADDEMSVVLSAHLFLEMIRKMPEDVVTLEIDEKLMVVVRSGDAQFNIAGMPTSEYPEIPTINGGAAITMPGDLLKNMIRQTNFAVAKTDQRPIYKGTFFEFKEKSLKLVSVDGVRLAMRDEKINCNEELSFVVPGKSLVQVNKLIDDEKNVSVAVGKNHIIFEIDGNAVISKLLDGEFLDYNAAIPPSNASEATVNTRAFIEAVERVSLLSSDKLTSPVRCLFENNSVKLACTNTLGKAYDQIECKFEGEKVEIGFNHIFLLDALRYSECDEVKILLNGNLSPMKIVPVEGDSFLFLILPVRIKNE